MPRYCYALFIHGDNDNHINFLFRVGDVLRDFILHNYASARVREELTTIDPISAPLFILSSFKILIR